MNQVKSIFNQLETSYLVKSYIISAVLLFGLLGSSSYGFLYTMVIILSAVLFPFAAFVWDNLMAMILGNNIIVLPIVFMVIWKIGKIMIIFSFSLLIAPIGIAYLLYQQKKMSY